MWLGNRTSLLLFILLPLTSGHRAMYASRVLLWDHALTRFSHRQERDDQQCPYRHLGPMELGCVLFPSTDFVYSHVSLGWTFQSIFINDCQVRPSDASRSRHPELVLGRLRSLHRRHHERAAGRRWRGDHRRGCHARSYFPSHIGTAPRIPRSPEHCASALRRRCRWRPVQRPRWRNHHSTMGTRECIPRRHAGGRVRGRAASWDRDGQVVVG
jgi:hypothetical protein